MKKGMKLFMALALALFMTLGTVPVNTVRAEEPVTETTNVTDETPDETKETEYTEASEEDPSAPAEEAEEGDKEEELPAETQPADPAEEDNKQEEETPAAAEGEEETSEEETLPEEQEEVPAYVVEQNGEYNGVKVFVSYPSDTFEKEVDLVVSEADETALKEAFGEGFKAVDISFVDEEGNKLQPLEGKSVNVILSAAGMENAGSYMTAHVTSNGKIEIVDEAAEATERSYSVTKSREVTETVDVPAVVETVTVNETKEVEVPAVVETRKVQKTKEVDVPAQYEFQNVEKTRTVVKTRRVAVPAVRTWWNPLTWFAKPTYKTEKYTDTETYYVKELVKVNDAHTKTETYYEEEQYVVTPAYTKTVVVGSHEEKRVVSEAYTKNETKTVNYEETVTVKDVESSFAAGSFSVYAIVPVDPEGSIDFDQTYAGNHLVVKAPAGAFDAGTVMKVETVDDPDVLINALKALDENQTYAFYAIDISFWKGETEVEPRLPVEVIWESANIEEGDQLVHIGDDNSADLVSAAVEDNKAVFTAREFSTYTTARLDEIDLTTATAIIFNPGSLTRPETMASGYVADTHPDFPDYTFENATVVRGGAEDTDDPVIYLGEFVYREFDEEGNQIGEDKHYVYYRTQSTANDSDLIVKLADDEMIRLNYTRTPFNVTYKVVYNGGTYVVGQDELPADLADLVFEGPDVVAENTTYENGVRVSLPRGYSATVRMSNESSNQAPALGEGSEPNYTCTDGWTVNPNDYPFTINGTYTIADVTEDLTVTLNVTKRTSYRFTAQPAFSTAYFGGTGNNRRYQNVTPSATYTFNGNTTTFRFTTLSSRNITWALDSLNINKQSILVPFVDSNTITASTTTTLTSGTIIKVTAEYLGGTYPNRRYTIEVSNCYENITITGGNLHNVTDKPEWVLQERENLSEFDYGSSSYLPLVAGEPMTYDGWQNYGNNAWTAWRNGTMSFTPRVIRFKVAEGYVNPQIKYVTPEGADDYTRVGDVTLASAATDFYHRITSEPDADGYYYFSLKGNSSSTYMGLLSARAELARYGVSYDAGSVSSATVPAFDEGGRYGNGTLQGYNIEDNDLIVLAKSAPVDPTKEYTFLYYTIDGGDDTRYAPSEKIELKDVAEYGVYDEAKGEYVIPFVAHWEKSATVEKVNITAKIYLDGRLEDTVVTVVPKESSVYIDIDSDTMHEVMEKYNWQAFYDESDSNPFIDNITEDKTVELRLYSKFYIYHSSTGKLELHTTKELIQENGTIGKLDITGLTEKGYLYGGYYTDYQGAHGGGKNLVKDAADDNNENGTLSANEIETLQNCGGIEIATVGTPYDPATNAGHVGYWDASNAFTATEKKGYDTNLFGDRGSKDPDVTTDKTGGNGMEVEVMRAGIYYIKEVPKSYLRPSHMTTYQRYDRYLRDFILFSTTDDTNYQTAGFVMGGNYLERENFSSEIVINFGPNYDDTVENGKETVNVGSVSANAGGYVTAYRWFHVDESSKNYTAIIGTNSFKPYWITLDGITVTGASSRYEVVKDKDSDGIIRVDPVDGANLKEIAYQDIGAVIKAFKQ